jgi:threonine dehydratase
MKLEIVQNTGSFKIRGASNRLFHLSDAERAQGVVAVSTGNHGRAVAYAAKCLGVRATVCLSHLVPENKVRAIREVGAQVRIVGKSYDEARAEGERLAAEERMVMVEAADDPFVIAGQGTIGLEILEDLPEVETVLVPVSSGGLIGGIALALKSAAPRIRVIGVSMERGPAMYHSLRAGKPVEVEELPTIADSLSGGIGLDNRYTFRLVRDYVDDIVLVSEKQIVQSMVHAFREERLVTEGAAVVGIAALLNHLVGDMGGTVVTVISGNNVDMNTFSRIVAVHPDGTV